MLTHSEISNAAFCSFNLKLYWKASSVLGQLKFECFLVYSVFNIWTLLCAQKRQRMTWRGRPSCSSGAWLWQRRGTLLWCPLLAAAFLEHLLNGRTHGRVCLIWFSQCFLVIASTYLYGIYTTLVHRVPLPGMETHIPVVFLNLKRKSLPFWMTYARSHVFLLAGWFTMFSIGFPSRWPQLTRPVWGSWGRRLGCHPEWRGWGRFLWLTDRQTLWWRGEDGPAWVFFPRNSWSLFWESFQ